jgi:hypothetical protein
MNMLVSIQKIRSKSLSELGMLIEACLLLLVAKFLIQLLPFSLLVRLFNNISCDDGTVGIKRNKIRCSVSWAVEAAARNMPLQFVCFPRGIAAHIMLHRRGVASTLYYGVAKNIEDGFESHVWVNDGCHGVVGHTTSMLYKVLMQYPQKRMLI